MYSNALTRTKYKQRDGRLIRCILSHILLVSVMVVAYVGKVIVSVKSVRVHFAYGSDGRSFFVEYS